MKSNIYKILGIVVLLCVSFWCGYQWQMKCSSQEKTDDTNVLLLPIYSVDINSYDEIVLDSIKISKDFSLEDKLQSLCAQLSFKSFYNLPVIIDSLIDLDDKKILYVNLKESIGKITWRGHMFQGSTGGYITSTTLLENFLQKNYNGDWIDGLLVSYEGVPFSESDYFDHMGGLIGIQWRDTI